MKKRKTKMYKVLFWLQNLEHYFLNKVLFSGRRSDTHDKNTSLPSEIGQPVLDLTTRNIHASDPHNYWGNQFAISRSSGRKTTAISTEWATDPETVVLEISTIQKPSKRLLAGGDRPARKAITGRTLWIVRRADWRIIVSFGSMQIGNKYISDRTANDVP